jgi:OHCU decarboxylase
VRLDELNALDEDRAARELLRCCGSTRWAREMADRRPFASIDALCDAADRVWRLMDRADMLEAFAAHPKIGEGAGLAGRAGEVAERTAWTTQEQSGARDAADDVRTRLAAGNRAYEARFGYIFIICATGRSAGEMLASLEARLHHAPDAELPVAAEEQRQITRLRLAKLVDGAHTP